MKLLLKNADFFIGFASLSSFCKVNIALINRSLNKFDEFLSVSLE